MRKGGGLEECKKVGGWLWRRSKSRDKTSEGSRKEKRGGRV